MNDAVVAAALAVAALNAIAGVMGSYIWYRGDPSGAAARAFWLALRVGQGAAVVFAVFVGVLAAAGRSSSEHLFYLYALLPLAVAFVAEQLRVVSAQTILDQRGLENAAAVGTLPQEQQQELMLAVLRRELGVMALSALVVCGLAVRAATTAHGF